jgi:apolipoprotein N-acyltransferase
VAWVALAPLLVALAGAPSARHGLRLGYLTGATSAFGLLYWTGGVVVEYGGLSRPVGLVILSLVCLILGLFPAVFGWTMAAWCRRFGPGTVLAAPVAWVAVEILRTHTLLDFPWCLLGYSQHATLPVLQLARYTAVYGVSFVVASPSALLAYLAVEARPSRRRAATVAVALGLLVVWGHGRWRLAQPVPEGGRLRVGLVQAAVRQEEKWDPDRAGDNLARHLALTQRAAAEGARLVVWPESAVTSSFDEEPVLAQMLRDTVRGLRLFLLFGNDDREPSPDGRDRFFVGAKMLDPGGTLRLRYHKLRLVPFGEYVPLAPAITLGGRVTAKLVEQVSDFTPGAGPVLGAIDGHPVAVFICYEAIFPGLVRRFSTRGAELLVNITNDAWFGRTSAPYQHMAMARFRAVENGKYLVRVANTGISAVVDPRGRLREGTGLFEETVRVAEVAFVPGETFYTRHGDVFAWGCLAAAAGLSAAAGWRRARADAATRAWTRRP